MMGIKWVSGVGLAYMAFAYLRDRFEPFHKLVDHPGYTFGAIAGGDLPRRHRARRRPHGRGAAQVAHRAPLEADEARVDHPRRRRLRALRQLAPAAARRRPATLPRSPGSTSEQTGRAKATAENKPVLIDFGATWCTACKELEHNTFPNAGVRSEAQRFVAIHVDATDDEASDTKRLAGEVQGRRPADGHPARRGRQRGDRASTSSSVPTSSSRP